MLILSRKTSERIHLDLGDGREVVILVEEIQSKNRVKIGLIAPDDVVILRGELVRPMPREGA